MHLPERRGRLRLDPQAGRGAVAGTIEAGGESWQLDGLWAVDDDSAGYHHRHTDWHWSAGVGRAADGRGGRLEPGQRHQRPAARSERAIWVDGDPREPEPVAFRRPRRGRASPTARGSTSPPSPSAPATTTCWLVRSRYRHLFGTFTGSLDGIELAAGFGVMEEHSAVW